MSEWQIKEHSYQIADTGDYDGYVEITNGKVSLFCDCDVDDEELKPIIEALNKAEIDFYLDNSPSIDLLYENATLREQLKRFEGAVEVEMYSETSIDKLIRISKTHKLYAIPKEQDDE